MSETLQVICNVIILIGGVVAAIAGIMAFFGKPINFFKKIHDKNETTKHDKIVSDVAMSVKKMLTPQFEEIYQQNLEQNESIETLTSVMKDSIGAEILTFYEAHKVKRIITETEKDSIEDLYKAYKAIQGNHYVDKIYERMTSWTITDEDGQIVENVRWWKLPK